MTKHLGSIRALCDHTGELIVLRDYYAFGMEWERPNAPATTDRYYYNGKEKQEIGNTGLLDYGARFYNPDIGRWTTLDPLASKYYNISPYAYCTGNPVRFIDIEGMFVGDPIKNPKIVRNRASNLYGEGIRILNGIRRTHQGFDYFAPIGTDVMAVKDGVVVQSKGYHVDYGKTITIEHKTEKGETVYTFYAHLSNVSVNDGDTVKEGEVIGKSGTTGNAASKGVKDQHLHFELRTQRQGARGLTGKKNPNEIVDTKFYSQNSDYPYQREIGVVKIDSEGKKEEMDVEN